MVIHATQHDRVAAIRRQSGLTAVRFHHRHIVDLGGDDRLAKPPKALRIDLGGKDAPLRPHLPCKGEGQFTLAGADICRHSALLKGEHLSETRHFAAVGLKSETTPAFASRANG